MAGSINYDYISSFGKMDCLAGLRLVSLGHFGRGNQAPHERQRLRWRHIRAKHSGARNYAVDPTFGGGGCVFRLDPAVYHDLDLGSSTLTQPSYEAAGLLQ